MAKSIVTFDSEPGWEGVTYSELLRRIAAALDLREMTAGDGYGKPYIHISDSWVTIDGQFQGNIGQPPA